MIDEPQLISAIQDFSIGDEISHVILISKMNRVRLIAYDDDPEEPGNDFGGSGNSEEVDFT